MHSIPLPPFALKNQQKSKEEKQIAFDDFVKGKVPTEEQIDSKVTNKKVKFQDIDDDHEGDWQTTEI